MGGDHQNPDETNRNMTGKWSAAQLQTDDHIPVMAGGLAHDEILTTLW